MFLGLLTAVWETPPPPLTPRRLQRWSSFSEVSLSSPINGNAQEGYTLGGAFTYIWAASGIPKSKHQDMSFSTEVHLLVNLHM